MKPTLITPLVNQSPKTRKESGEWLMVSLKISLNEPGKFTFFHEKDCPKDKQLITATLFEDGRLDIGILPGRLQYIDDEP